MGYIEFLQFNCKLNEELNAMAERNLKMLMMMELKKVINGVGPGQGSRDDDYEIQEKRIIYPDHAD